ncbi:hydroxyacid-oxoacid transhydrogenase, mitochondrial-like [Bolinopsis microptera]|uniref:hydroxyacid-oxoacid transhydrogenase, mitochondrial-like n=1 Tax=Bolinopsis microptera TaxID=2820187 RepID=UPI00307AD772
MSKAKHLLRLIRRTNDCCPMHSQTYGLSNSHVRKEYALEMACSSIRYGPGVTEEVGMDFENMGAKKVAVITDKNLAVLPPVIKAVEALERAGVQFELFDNVRVEPTDSSFKECIEFARRLNPDAFLAVGGGSVIDTAKAANLYNAYPEADFLDFVNAPVGRGLPVTRTLSPLIAVPTTAGTGSETTGVSVFDYEPLKAKTGIANRAIRPTLGIVDPENILTMPERVTAYSGFDVLCHAIESYTALPYTDRPGPAPTNPKFRPAYQGSNPLSDVWSRHACFITAKYFKRAVKDPEDYEARQNMHLASAMAGVGFGNAGVHLCHGLSYSISGLNRNYRADNYPSEKLIPHGLSVCITAPAVFAATADSSPDRHAEIAELLGGKPVRKEDAGKALPDVLREYLHDLDVPDGLGALGYSDDDIPGLVAGALPQKRVLCISPIDATAEPIAEIYANSMKNY